MNVDEFLVSAATSDVRLALANDVAPRRNAPETMDALLYALARDIGDDHCATNTILYGSTGALRRGTSRAAFLRVAAVYSWLGDVDHPPAQMRRRSRLLRSLKTRFGVG